MPITPLRQHSAKSSSTSLRHPWRATFALAAIGCTLLATAGASARQPNPLASETPAAPEPTATPWPTPTPTPLPPPPIGVPPGWQVYRAHHFAVAYPLGWEPIEHVVRNWDGSIVEVSVSFNSADGASSIGIAEREGLDYDALRAFCATPGTQTTYAGLPMTTSRTAATLRMFVFVSAGGVAYTLLYKDEATSTQTQHLYDTILGTFRPEVATSACA